MSKVHVKEDTINQYVPEKINGAFNDKYIAYKSKGDPDTSIYQYLEYLDHIWVI